MITFEKETHKYKFNGIGKHSQSEIVGYFFRDEFLPPQHILDYAGAKGTAIHKAIELYESNDLGELPKWLEPYLEQWKLYRKENKDKFIAKEVFLYSKTYDFCGTIDVITSGGLILDIKSGGKYLKHTLQTAMYSLLAEDNGYEIKKRGCLYIKEDSFKFEEHKVLEDIDVACSMIKIFHWAVRNKVKK